MYKINLFNTEWDLTLIKSHYRIDGSLAVVAELEDGSCFSVLTVNLEEYTLSDEYAFIDTNNCPWAEKILTMYKIAEPVGITAPSGYCEYPLYKFDLTKLEEDTDE